MAVFVVQRITEGPCRCVLHPPVSFQCVCQRSGLVLVEVTPGEHQAGRVDALLHVQIGDQLRIEPQPDQHFLRALAGLQVLCRAVMREPQGAKVVFPAPDVLRVIRQGPVIALDVIDNRNLSPGALRPDDGKVDKDAKLNPKDDEEAIKLRNFMCKNFFDVRSFGAVMSTGVNCGQVRGPVQVTFASSVEPIVPVEISITRMAATNEAEKKQRAEGSEESNDRTDNRTMGRKHIVPYGLYRAHGFISAKLAERTGFADADLETLFNALSTMFEHDRSAARGEMTTRKLIVFKHQNAMGNAPAHSLFERVKIGRNVGGVFREVDDAGIGNYPPARKFSDYIVTIDQNIIPEGVEIIERV